MKGLWLAVCPILLVASEWETGGPLAKVMEMLQTMQDEVISEGEAQQKAYVRFSGMCTDRSRELHHEVKTAKAKIEELTANIAKATDEEAQFTAEIEELAGTLATGESDLKASAAIRDKEAAEFQVNQKDFQETISEIERAIGILEKQYKSAAFAQLSPDMVAVQQARATDLTNALSTIVDASFIGTADASNLVALIQSSEEASDATDADAQLDAAVASYAKTKSKGDGSSSILELLDSLLEKAQAQYEGARHAEVKSAHNFDLFSQSLKHKMQVGTTRMYACKGGKGEAGQARAAAEGKLATMTNDLAEDKKSLGALHHECMMRSTSFEEESKDRNAELKALTMAKSILEDMTGGGKKAALAQVSFLQTKSKQIVPPSNLQVVEMVRQLGESQNMPALMQVSRKMDAVIHNSMVSGLDPFEKVKSMLDNILGRLTREMEAQATHKVYCDREMGETRKSLDVKAYGVRKLTTKIDSQTSDSMKLKEEIAELQEELLANARTQTQMNSMRQTENALYKKTKPELERGLEDVKKALKVLREYYSQDENDDSGKGSTVGSTGVINMLEVVESDFTKNVAAVNVEEETAEREYKEQTHENEISKAMKNAAVVGKTREFKRLDKMTSESANDRDGTQTELDAVTEYWTKIQQECVAKPEPYAERRKRQVKSLEGLKEAKAILEGKSVLLQDGSKGSRHGHLLRGSVTDDE